MRDRRQISRVALLVAGLTLATACAPSKALPTTTAMTTAPVTTVQAAVSPVTAATATAATVVPPVQTGPGLVGPVGEAFYTAPSGEPGKPGSLIWSRSFPMEPGLKGWTILYWSTTAAGKPVAVSGTVISPTVAGSPTDRKVLAWAHGTVGLGDVCAPSHTFASGTAPELAFAPLLTQTGAVFVATDYEGLGTPGDPAYLVGRSEGHGVLDAARAAQQLDVGVTAASTVLLWGHSQGGGAAAWAAELAPSYAPDLKIIGAMLGAPAGELASGAMSGNATGSVLGYSLAALIGFKAAYPDLDLDSYLTSKGQEVAAKLRSGCSAEDEATVAGLTSADLLKPGLVQSADWAKDIAENNPAQRATPVPLFIYHGEADTTVPASVSAAMLAKYCKLGVVAQRKVYPGKGHVDVIAAAITDLVAFATARWDGAKPIDSCP